MQSGNASVGFHLDEANRMLTVEDQIVISLRRISQAIDVWSRQMLQTCGLTSPQAAILREVMAGNTATGTLATALHLSAPTVSSILTRLEQRELIVRARSREDRRGVIVEVTEAGRELASKAPTLLRDSFCQELVKLPVEEQERILHTLRHVAEMMHAPEVGSVPFLYSD
jgi:DNA-binding MarR family transcriptional regulator